MFRYSLFRNARKTSNDKEEKESENTVEEVNNSVPSVKLVTDRALLLSRGYVLLGDENLGEGSYSKVKRAYSKYHACDVAVKIVNRDIAPKDFLSRFLPRELEIIGHLKHENICKFYEVLDTVNKVYIIMELAHEGDLLDYIQKYKYMSERVARKLLLQVCQKNFFFIYLNSLNFRSTSNFAHLFFANSIFTHPDFAHIYFSRTASRVN